MELSNMDTKDLLELTAEIGVSSDTSVKDLLGLQLEIPETIYQITIGKYRLAITWGGQWPSVIYNYKGNIYTLNIQDKEPHHRFNWKGEWAKDLISKQLDVFMPTIQKFMIEALTDGLKKDAL